MKFSHGILNLETGFKLTMIGIDEKIYNYLLSSKLNNQSLGVQQLVELFSSILVDIEKFKHGLILLLSQNFFLEEIPKNQVTFHRILTAYMQSKQHVVDFELFTIQQHFGKYKKLDYGT